LRTTLKNSPTRAGGDEGEGDPIDFVHPHPLNHVRFRALSCTLRGGGLTLPHRRGREYAGKISNIFG